jgi:hypothetical protein
VADEIRAKLVLDDKDAVGPLRRVGAEAKATSEAQKKASDEQKRSADSSKKSTDGAARSQEELAKKTRESAEAAAKLAREIGKLNAKAVFNDAKAASNEYQLALSRVAAQQRKVTEETAKVQTTTQGTTSSVRLMGVGAVAAYTQVAQAALDAAGEVADFARQVWEAGRAGARITDLQNAFTALGGSTAELTRLREAVNNTVSDAQLIKFRNMGVALGIPAESFDKLAKIAANAALATGQSFDFMLDSVVRGTARESALILDNLGIKIKDPVATITAELERMGATAETATAKQRALAMINVASAASANLAVVGSMESQAAAYAQTEAKIQNFIGTLQQTVNETLIASGAFDAIDSIVRQVSEVFADNKEEVKELGEVVVKLADMVGSRLFDEFERFAAIAGTVLDVLGPVLDLSVFLTKGFNDLVSEVSDSALSFVGLSDEGRALGDVFRDVVAVTAQQSAEKVADLRAEVKKLKAEFKLGDAATDSTIGKWSLQIAEGKNLEFIVADIAAQSTSLEEAMRDLSKIGYNIDQMEGVHGFDGMAAFNNYDAVLQGVEAKFNKAPPGGGGRKAAPKGEKQRKFGFAQENATIGAFIGGAAAGGAGQRDYGTRAETDYTAMFGLDAVGEGAARVFEAYRTGISDAIEEYRTGISDAIEEVNRFAEANAALAESVQITLANGFVGALDAMLSGATSFREEMLGVMGGMISELAVAFGAWATTEGALLAGNPFLALVTVSLMKLAGSRVAAFGKRSSSGGGSADQAARYQTRRADNQAQQKQILEVNLHGIPVPDRTARELANAVGRGMKLSGG